MSPNSGDTDTTFTFSAHYYDAEGDPPMDINVVIDGIDYQMELVTGDIADGTYEFEIKLAEGTHTYYFKASDGISDAITDDDTPVNAADQTTTSEVKETKKEAETDWMPYLILIITIIIIIVLLVLLMSRRKPAEEELLAGEEDELAAAELETEPELDGMPPPEELEQMPLEEEPITETAEVEGTSEDDAEDPDAGDYECPDCGGTLGVDDTICPDCGAEFED
jgi:flagellar biosynthesis/type III secretory pathway M-ring protein FliF/YscJ